MDPKGRSHIYGVADLALDKRIIDVYLSIDEYDFYLKNVLVSWTRDPDTTKDIYIEIKKPQDVHVESWQAVRLPVESITTPNALKYLDYSDDLNIYYLAETSIHLVITGHDPDDPPTINISCLGIQPFTRKQVKYQYDL